MGMPDTCRFDFRYFDIYDASGTKAGEEVLSSLPIYIDTVENEV